MKKLILSILASGIIFFSFGQSVNDFSEKLDSSWSRFFDQTTGEWVVKGKAHFIYNEQNLLASIRFEGDHPLTGLFAYNHLNEFIYDDSGLATTFHLSFYDTLLNDWKRVSTETYAYDANGNLTEHITINLDPDLQELVNYSKIVTAFSASNKISERLRYNWDDNTNEWIESSKNVMTYNAQDSLLHTERYYYVPSSGSWEISDSTSYAYDDQHYLVSKEAWIEIGFGLEPYTKFTYVNNASGQPDSSISAGWNANTLAWEPDRLYINTYEINGKRESFSDYNWNPIGEYWEGFTKYEYSYTAAGDQESTIRSDWDDDLEQWVLSLSVEYVYDENADGSTILWPQIPNEPAINIGKKLLEIIDSEYNRNTEEWELDQSTIYFYSDIVALAPVTSRGHSIFPNPAHDHFYIEMSSLSSVAEVEFFNSNGQLVHSGVLMEGNPLSVENLAPGIYSYRVRNNKEWLTGKFVKH